MNLPAVSIALPALAEKDKQDLIFGCEQGVDFVAASFIRSVLTLSKSVST
ncbi:pyruvate kinase [Escherichia coli]